MADQPGNWGRWGANDERGLLNVITPDHICNAAGLIKKGKVYSLAIPLQKNAPIWPTRHKNWHVATYNNPTGPGYGGSDDQIHIHTHGTTHMDALSHMFSDGQMYNGHPASQINSTGTSYNAIDNVGAIVGRGVLLDFPRHLGIDHLELGHNITGEQLEACAQAQGVSLGAGDILCLRTGWINVWKDDPERYDEGEPGIGLDAARWLAERDVVGVAADNSAVEVIPTETGNLGVHIELIRNQGMYLMELFNFDELAADGVFEFLFIAAPLRITRGVGSPLNPLAIA